MIRNSFFDFPSFGRSSLAYRTQTHFLHKFAQTLSIVENLPNDNHRFAITTDTPPTISQSWPPNSLSRASALSKSSLTSSSTPRSRPSQPESERVDEDGTRTLDWASGHQRPPLREAISVCRSQSIDGNRDGNRDGGALEFGK